MVPNRSRFARRAVVAAFAAVPALAAPAAVAAHGIQEQYQSPLPLAVYLIGAGLTVALSFLFVLARDVRAEPPADDGELTRVPAIIRYGLRVIGLVGWLWVVAQGVVGGNSDANVGTLFLWVYGWVGVAALSALLGPIWLWLDPFTTIFDLGATAVRRLGLQGWQPVELPRALDGWPAVVGLVFFIWLELVQGGVGSGLYVVVVAYTAFTLAMMAQFGRDTWRTRGETFGVWFGLLNRLAPFGVVSDPDDDDPDAVREDVVRRRPFASGLLVSSWRASDVALVAVATAGILFDGLSQARPVVDVIGSPQLVPKTILLLVWLGGIAAAALAVGRAVGISAIGAGLVPISVGYLLAHYLTYLLVDGQRIVIAFSDPFQQGANLFGTAFYEPNASFLAPGLTWTIQLASVVGGHMLGAWAGHAMAAKESGETGRADPRLREVPLAVAMVALTTITLWSLGQAIVVTPAAA